MGWQIPICQKGRRPLKEVCLTAFAESEFGNPFSLPNQSSATHLFFGNPFSLPKRTGSVSNVGENRKSQMNKKS